MKRITIFVFIVLALLGANCVYAQSGQMLSVTPPLFQISVEPGSVWQSSIKVVNGNPYELTVYAEVVNFVPYGESGQGKFVPIINSDADKTTLAEWIEISPGPHRIAPEQTDEVPFFIEVPKDAPPGGHFAAVLISTEPPTSTGSPLAVKTSQAITSLFFLRIEGDVLEKGSIREFRALDTMVNAPEAEFSLRFENKGNVHIQPRGNIVITNMWGKERGIIPVNSQSHFGNVLPESIRDFRFTWKGERSISEIGRYKAEATLGYGSNGVKTEVATTYFYVIPLKATAITLIALISFIALITWMIRTYIRHMLALAGVDPDEVRSKRTKAESPLARAVEKTTYRTVAAPIRRGANDLSSRLHHVTEFLDVVKTIALFMWNYKKFFVTIALLIAAFVGVVLYINDASKSATDYEITIEEGDRSRVLTDDEIQKIAE